MYLDIVFISIICCEAEKGENKDQKNGKRYLSAKCERFIYLYPPTFYFDVILRIFVAVASTLSTQLYLLHCTKNHILAPNRYIFRLIHVF